jgi:hypothetical protein
MMERLTKVTPSVKSFLNCVCPHHPKATIFCKDCPAKNFKEQLECCPAIMAIQRLAAYEDTNLTPAEVTDLAQAKKEHRILPHKPGDIIWDSFGMEWQITCAELHLIDGKLKILYRCGHADTKDYCALYEDEAYYTREFGEAAALEWDAEIEKERAKHEQRR